MQNEPNLPILKEFTRRSFGGIYSIRDKYAKRTQFQSLHVPKTPEYRQILPRLFCVFFITFTFFSVTFTRFFALFRHVFQLSDLNTPNSLYSKDLHSFLHPICELITKIRNFFSTPKNLLNLLFFPNRSNNFCYNRYIK